jgi:hypothetical protein
MTIVPAIAGIVVLLVYRMRKLEQVGHHAPPQPRPQPVPSPPWPGQAQQVGSAEQQRPVSSNWLDVQLKAMQRRPSGLTLLLRAGA